MTRPTRHREIGRIGLLSPCSGNLGNAAILSAIIANIRDRISDVEILGITLSPDDTRRRHGIPTFPIAGLSVPYYSVFLAGSSEIRPRNSPKFQRLKQWAKRIPLLGRCVRTIRTCRQELAHIAAATRVVRKLDRLIIPGGGALDEFWGGPWGHPWTLFKWSLLSRVYGVPLLFVSVGKCSLQRPLSRFFVRVALNVAEYRSYRDQESKIAVQEIIDARNDPVYPDLAFSYRSSILQPASSPDSGQSRLVVGVSPIDYCDPRVWPIKDERRYAAYLRMLSEVVKWLLKEGHQIILFSTDGPDNTTINDIQAIISESSIDANAIQTLTGPPQQTTEGLLNEICRADLIIASRLHGVILSHLNATPALALSYDPKVDVHMNDLGQGKYCLHVDDLQARTVIERFGALVVARQQEAAHLCVMGQIFRERLNEQYDRLLGAKRSSSATPGHQDLVPASSPSLHTQ